mgnify:CR=1 FL=1
MSEAGQRNRAEDVNWGSSGGLFWYPVLCGTAVSGGVFGLVSGLVFSLSEATGGGEGLSEALSGAGMCCFVGLCLAGILVAPVTIVVALLSWILRLNESRTYPAIMIGGLTGLLSAAPLWGCEFFSFGSGPVLASIVGAMGAWTAVASWQRRAGMLQKVDEKDANSKNPAVTRALHLRGLTATAVVFVVVGIGVTIAVRHAREASHRERCKNNLKQIALALQNYQMAHKSLSPAFLTNKAGQPTLSWRTNAARYCYYETVFSKLLDTERPWNQQKDQQRIDRMASIFQCPSSGKTNDDPRTDYVAVVGSNTLWPGATPGDLRKHRKGILVVEWPKSNIHWAEPRDITVEEFLDWFGRPQPRRGFWDWLFVGRHDHNSFHPDGLLYVDGEGNVGLLKNNTDPEIVRRMLRGE